MVPSWKVSVWMLLCRYFLNVLNIKICSLWVKQITLHNVMGLIQSVEGLKRKDSAPHPGTVRSAASDCFLIQDCNIHSCENFQPPGIPVDFRPSSPLYLSLYTYILLALFLGRTLTNTPALSLPSTVKGRGSTGTWERKGSQSQWCPCSGPGTSPVTRSRRATTMPQWEGWGSEE